MICHHNKQKCTINQTGITIHNTESLHVKVPVAPHLGFSWSRIPWNKPLVSGWSRIPQDVFGTHGKLSLAPTSTATPVMTPSALSSSHSRWPNPWYGHIWSSSRTSEHQITKTDPTPIQNRPKFGNLCWFWKINQFNQF